MCWSNESVDTMERVAIVQTGGTIDKAYPQTTGGYAFEIQDPPAATAVLERGRVQPCMIEYHTVCKKDSQDITNEDRDLLISHISTLDCPKVLITHGTDTLIDTAQYLAASTALAAKTVILTGARLPETFKDTDADFNVGVAFGALQCLKECGVYVAMNGNIVKSDCVKRNMKTGTFEVPCMKQNMETETFKETG